MAIQFVVYDEGSASTAYLNACGHRFQFIDPNFADASEPISGHKWNILDARCMHQQQVILVDVGAATSCQSASSLPVNVLAFGYRCQIRMQAAPPCVLSYCI
jgi:hypothetical protein